MKKMLKILVIAFFLITLQTGIVFAANITSKSIGLWSSSSTWDLNRLPATGDIVIIVAGHHVVYDVNSPTTEITKMQIFGTLNFSKTATTYLTMKGNLIVEAGGKLEIGDPTKPILNTTTATIKFLLNEALVVGGATTVPLDTDVGLWVMGEFRAEGARKYPSWTKLFETANAGATTIVINEEPLGWAIGDEIVVTPSRKVIPSTGSAGDSGYNEFDMRKINAITRRADGAYIITLNQSLTYSHPVTVASTGDILAPEVLHMTRNIIIQGQDQNNHAHNMAMQSGKMWISNVKYLYMGPADKLGRYPVHWHKVGAAAIGNYVRNSVIQSSTMRAVVVHESNGTDVTDNIAYDIRHSPYWLENSAVEQEVSGPKDEPRTPAFIRFVRNVAAKVGPLVSEGESGGLRLAGFEWQTRFGNKFMGNIAVGIRGTRSAAGFVWPEKGQPQDGTLTFIKNEVHNNRINGVFLWHNTNVPDQYVDTLTWRNGADGIQQGAYHTDYKWFTTRAIGNGKAGIVYLAVDSEFYDTVIDGEGVTEIGFQALIEGPTPPSRPFRITGSKIINYTVVAFSQLHKTCGAGPAEEFNNLSSGCAKVWRHLWDNDYGTGKHFDFDGHVNHFSQWNVYNYPQSPFNFILHRSDYPAGTYNSTFDANLVPWRYEVYNAPKRPTVTLTSPVDSTVASGTVTITAAATNTNKVEFLLDGELIGSDTTAPYSITWNFDTHPYQYAFIFARALNTSNNENASSRVAVIRKPLTGQVVTPTFDFLLSNSGTITVTQGSSGSNTITATLTSGTAQSVSFSVSGLPTGATHSFSPTSCNPTCTTTLTITTATTTPAGSYVITVTGTSSSIIKTTTFTLTVNALPSSCTLTSASITPACSGGSSTNCEAGESITMSGTYTGDCSAADFFQIDAAGGGCDIQFSGGDMSGISDSTITVSGGSISGSWTIPTIPSACSAQTVTATAAALYDGGPPGTGTWLTGTTATGSITFASTLPAAFDFSLSNSGPIVVTQGSSGSNTITATLVSGVTQLVSFSASGLPTGATFTPMTSCSPNPTCTSTLTITTSPTTPVGTYTITVTGTAAISGLTRTTTYTLTVNMPPVFDFSLALSPASETVTQGGSALTTATTTLLSGTTQSVSFSCSGLPTGASCSFIPVSCNPTCTSTLIITTATTTPTGTYAITISASASVTKTATYTLTVIASTAQDITPPVVLITHPPENDVIFGVVDINATVTDNVGVSKVEFYIDSIKVDSDKSAPYRYVWNTSTAANTTHAITVKGFDSANNTNSRIITVTVDQGRKIADITGDGDVDLSDIIVIILAWGTPGPTDINGDGVTNLIDIGILLSKWTG